MDILDRLSNISISKIRQLDTKTIGYIVLIVFVLLFTLLKFGTTIAELAGFYVSYNLFFYFLLILIATYSYKYKSKILSDLSFIPKFVIASKNWTHKRNSKIIRDKRIIILVLICIFILIKKHFQNISVGVSVESDLVYYDAQLLLEGFIPYKEFITREPYLLLLTTIMLSIFGKGVAFFNFHLIFYGLTLLVVYKIGVEVLNSKLGLINLILYGISPYLLKFHSSNYQFYGTIYLFFLSCSILYLIKCLKNKNRYLIAICGILFGFSVMVYRGALPFVFLYPILGSYAVKDSFKNILSNQLIYLSALIIGLFPPIVFFTTVVNLRWLNYLLLIDKILIVVISLIPISIAVYVYKQIFDKQYKKFQGPLLVLLLMFFAFFFLFTIADNTSLQDKVSVIHDYTRHAGYYMFPSLLIIIRVFFSTFFSKIKNTRIVFLINLAIFLIVFEGANHLARGTSFRLDSTDLTTFIVLQLIYCFIHFLFLGDLSVSKLIAKQFLLIMSCAVVFQLTFNLMFIEWVDHYLINYILFFVLLTAYLIYYSYVRRKYSLFFLLILSILFFTNFTSGYYKQYNFNQSSEIKVSEMKAVIELIRNKTEPGEEIFTANPTFAFRSNRTLALNITHPLIYIANPPYFSDYSPYNTVPTIKDITRHLEENEVNLIIGDRRTRSLFVSNRHPILSKYIEENYYHTETIGSIYIYQRYTF